MTIIEKIIKDIELDPKEIELEGMCVLLQISKIRTIILKMNEKDQEDFSKALSTLMIYYPKGWSKTLLNGMDEEIKKKLIEEEQYLI